MRVKRWLKPLFKMGATTIAAGLNGGLAGPMGRIVGSVLARNLGIDQTDPGFEKKVARYAQTSEGRERILLAEKELQARKNELFSQLEVKELEASVRYFTEAQQSYRVELKTGDKYITRTRPMIVRRLFMLAVVMVLSLIGAVIMDGSMDDQLLTQCFALEKTQPENFKECLKFIEDREPYAKQITNAYSENWQWLSLLFSILGLYFGGRSFERRFNVQAKD